MKKNFVYIAVQAVFIWSFIVTVYSIFCFVTYEKIPCTVADIDNGFPESGKIVHLQYTVNDTVYEHSLDYGTKSVKIGEQLSLWYKPDNPEKAVCVRDFAGYYWLLAIMGSGLYLLPCIGFLLDRMQKKHENKHQH